MKPYTLVMVKETLFLAPILVPTSNLSLTQFIEKFTITLTQCLPPINVQS